jgi:UDP-N-acetylmuramate--alanine ligase
MVDLGKIRKIYFIGIGGIGMSALARYFRFHGKEVSGYDRTETTLTRQLEDEGILVHYEDNVELAPKDAELVVYTPAVPGDHQELSYYREHQYPILKRSDVLGAITRSSFNICVAGTHGKTTVSTMTAHILRHSGYGCNAFLGGIAVNYSSNYWSDLRNVCVVEADEYDRSFLKLTPDIAVITAMDPDHLDIYGTAGQVEEAFIDFSGKIKPGGLLLSRYGLKRSTDLAGTRKLTYHLTDHHADIYAENIRRGNGGYVFDLRRRAGWHLRDLVLNMGGLHNVENAAAAMAVACELGIGAERIKAAIEDFRGVRRRFEYVLNIPARAGSRGLVFIDDYAHHPEELKALIGGARGLFPDLGCTVIFQPHLYSRTKDFADGFAESLDLADQVILMPLYPAREKPVEGVSSRLILDKMKCRRKSIMDKKEILEWIESEPVEMLITAGAGDIDGLVQPIREILEKKN